MSFFILSICFYILQNISNKEFGRRFAGIRNATLVQNGLCVSVAALVMLLVGGFSPLPVPILLLAVAFGVTYLLTIFLLVRSMDFGSMGASTLLCNIGMFISTLYGVFVYQDEITIPTTIAMFCMLGVIILSTPFSHGRKAESDKVKWFFLALGSGLMNGVVASIKRTVSAMSTSLNMTNFLFWGFLFAAITFLLLFPLFRPAGGELKKLTLKPKTLLLCGIGAGVGTSGGNLLQMMSLNSLSSVIVYPLTAGLLVLLLWAISLFWYKEAKLELRNGAAIVLCLLGMLLNSL